MKTQSFPRKKPKVKPPRRHKVGQPGRVITEPRPPKPLIEGRADVAAEIKKK